MSEATNATGSVPGVHWESLCYSVTEKHRQQKWILCGISGQAKPGRLLAILGPSGSGKTTLLKILAGRMPRVRGARLGGTLTVHPSITGNVAYVAQETGFFSCLTVQETLAFTASMEGLPEGNKRVVSAMHRLGLSNCKHTKVGGDSGGVMVAGISGGERRRLSIACEIIGNNTGVVVADEPTTGLDSFQAGKTMQKLSEMARTGGTIVICSLHGPRSSIIPLLDDLLLLTAGGRACYMGPGADVLPYFATLGHACPAHYNPAEFLLDLISVDTTNPEELDKEQQRVFSFELNWDQVQHQQKQAGEDAQTKVESAALEMAATEPNLKRPGPWKQFKMLALRAFRQQARDMHVNTSRAVASTLIGLALGTVNFKLGFSQKSIQSRASLLVQMCINTSMMATIKSLNGFSRERQIVIKEMSRSRPAAQTSSQVRQVAQKEVPGGGYGIGPYFLSKFLVDTPLDSLFAMLFAGVAGHMAHLNPKSRGALAITAGLQAASASTIGLAVSALTPSSEVALAVGPVVMIFSLMLADTGGMFAPVPKFLKPLSHLSCIKWGFEGTLCGEFKGLTFDQDVESLLDGNTLPETDKSQKTGGALGSVISTLKGDAGRMKAQREAMQKMCAKSGEEVLSKLDLADQTVTGAARAQCAVIAANLAMTYLALKSQGSAGASNQQTFDTTLKAPSSFELLQARAIQHNNENNSPL